MNRARWVGPARLAVTAAAAGGLVALATVTPAAPAAPSTEPAASGSTLAPVTTASVSCPGPELSGIDGVEDIAVSAAIGAATAPDEALGGVEVGRGGGLALRSGARTSSPVDDRGVTTTTPAPEPVGTEVLATGAMAPGLAATQEWAVATPEVRGLATVPCAGPGSDVWLLAGGGAAGRQERLVLTNPGANEVTVDLQVLGRRGVVQSPTGATVVPAHGRISLLVDAITGDEESPAVRVRANGGAVRAVMSDIWLDGSVPAGAETSGPTAAPSKRQVIPGALVGTSGSIRIAVPGAQQAVVSARVVGKDGASPLPGGGVVRVPGRSTGELAITGVPAATYAVELTSDVPVVASMWSTQRRGEAAGDFLWAPSTEPASGLLGGAFPELEGEHARVVSIASTGAPATVSLTWRESDAGAWTTQQVTLSQDASTAVNLGAARSVWVRRTSGAGEVRASVVTTTGATGLVSLSPLVDSPVTSQVSSAYPIS